MNLLDYAAYGIVWLLIAAFVLQVGRELWNWRRWSATGADEYLPVATVLAGILVVFMALARLAQLQ